jgi:hypothetical protein
MTVTQLINEACGESLQGTVRQATTELASVEAGCKVHWLFRPSIVDLETGMHGLRWLIARLLSEANAFTPQTGMTSHEIISKVRAVNGFDKYPNATIYQNLSVVMFRSKQVCKARLSRKQSLFRTAPGCKRSVLVWHLPTEQASA